MALEFGDINAITNAFYMAKFRQVAFDKNILLMKAHKAGELAPSGEYIKVPLKYQFNKAASYFPWEKHDMSGENQITSAKFNWKFYVATLIFSGEEILKNDGPHGIKKLIEAKLSLAQDGIREEMATDLFTRGSSATGDSSRGLTSLYQMVQSTTAAGLGGTGNTYGGINKSTDGATWWQGKVTKAASAGTYDELEHAQQLYKIFDGDTRPDLIVSDMDTLYQHFKENVERQRYVGAKSLDQGWVGDSFLGIPWIGDRHCHADDIFHLNFDEFKLMTHTKRNFKLMPYMVPDDQDVQSSRIYWAGETTCSDCRRNGIYQINVTT
jgi:hypothetical protein